MIKAVRQLPDGFLIANADKKLNSLDRKRPVNILRILFLNYIVGADKQELYL